MKRLAALLILLAMLPAVACADNLEEFRGIYNNIAEIYNAQPLPEKYDTWKMDNGNDMVIFSFSDPLKLHAYVSGGDVYGFSVICRSDDAALDFMMACEIGNFTLDSGIKVDVLLNYMLARTGDKTYASRINGYAYYLKKDGNEYTYIIAKE